MAFKYNVNGVGLDAIFDPYVSGTKAALTGYTTTIGGVEVDLRDQFAPIYLGTTAAITNYTVTIGGVVKDLNQFFAAHGSARYNIPGLQGNTYSVVAIASDVAGQPGASVNCSLAFNNTGLYSLTANVVSSGGGGGTIAGFPTSGTWLPTGWVVSDCEIQFAYVETVLETGPAVKTNPAPSYVSLTTSRAFLMSAVCAATSPNGNGSSLAMTLNIRQISSGAVITTTFTVACNAAPGV